MKYFEIEIKTAIGNLFYYTFALNYSRALNTCLAYLEESEKNSQISEAAENGDLKIIVRLSDDC